MLSTVGRLVCASFMYRANQKQQKSDAIIADAPLMI